MSTIGKLFNPLFEAISWLLAFYYNLIPNYAVAIALLTLSVMVVLVPLTVKSTRSMIEMQRLQPEIKRVQQAFKDDRLRQQQELQALFKENGVSPAGGCLPMLLQFPIFLILYRVVRGLTNTKKGPHGSILADPKYISHSSLIYHHLVSARPPGSLEAFGINMSKSPLSSHTGFFSALPFWLLVAVSVALQYVQYRQMMSRNSQQGANQQMQQIQKYMPLLFGIIYIEIPVAVTVYFIVSSLCRIAQQTLMYRYDPKLRSAMEARRAAAAAPPPPPPPPPKELSGARRPGSSSRMTPPPAPKAPAPKAPAPKGPAPKAPSVNPGNADGAARARSSRGAPSRPPSGNGNTGANGANTKRNGAKGGPQSAPKDASRRGPRGR
jgi:YidC/Oxa1 family membrane protein insertase